MDIDTIVLGHGFVCTKQEITDLKYCLTELRKQVEECYDHKLSKEQALSKINMGVYREWSHQERLTLNVDQLYKEFGGTD